MYTLQVSACFDSAHFLKDYDGKCKNIHGHRWKVEATVAAEDVDEEGQTKGMIVDFKTLKADLSELTEKLDHSLIIEKGSLKETTRKALEDEDFSVVELDFRPTAENLARYLYEEIEDKGYQVILVKVYETPNNCAGYSE